MKESSQPAPHTRGGLRGMVSGFLQSTMLRVLRIGINVVVTGLLARHLGSAGFGSLAASLALVSLLYSLAELGMGRLLVRELLRDGADKNEVLGSSFFTRVAVSVILFCLLVLYVVAWRPAHGALLIVYGFVLLTHPVTDVLAWFEAERRLITAAWCQFAGFAISMAVIIGGIVWNAPLWFFALAFVIECLITTILLIFNYHQLGGSCKGWRWHKQRAVSFLGESMYEIAAQLSLLMLLRVDTIMVGALRGETEVGYYSAAVRISEVAYFLPMMLAGFILPPLMERKQRDASEYQRGVADYFGVTIAIMLPVSLGIALTADWLVALLFGPQFMAASPMLIVHAWALVPFALGIARTQYLTLEKRLWANVPAVVAALLINLVLNWMWIPSHGGLGAAWATLIAYSVAWVLSTPCMSATRDLTGLMMRGIMNLPRLLNEARTRLLRHDLPHEPAARPQP
ncbi:MAG: hypothetical protein B7Z47_00445 [Chthoniobacter sp. 12-60-6]|nr:MAG: hypothetical protein B7Z47_00445 [Chthoniobacter sp. 12-60-6]